MKLIKPKVEILDKLDGQAILDRIEQVARTCYKSDTNISIDRIDSNKHYTIDNIQLVTKQANICKHILNNREFLELCNKVVNHANQQPSQPLTKLEGSETNS